MSYSRWLNSDWYVFWHTSKAKRKEDELLAIWHVSDKNLPIFTYSELKNVRNIEDLKNLLKLDIPDSEYEECLVYVREWLKDVEEKL